MATNEPTDDHYKLWLDDVLRRQQQRQPDDDDDNIADRETPLGLSLDNYRTQLEKITKTLPAKRNILEREILTVEGDKLQVKTDIAEFSMLLQHIEERLSQQEHGVRRTRQEDQDDRDSIH